MSDKIPGDILEDQSVPGAPTTVRRGPPAVVPVPAPVPATAPLTEPGAALPFGTVVGASEDMDPIGDEVPDDNYDEEEAINDGEDE